MRSQNQRVKLHPSFDLRTIFILTCKLVQNFIRNFTLTSMYRINSAYRKKQKMTSNNFYQAVMNLQPVTYGITANFGRASNYPLRHLQGSECLNKLGDYSRETIFLFVLKSDLILFDLSNYFYWNNIVMTVFELKSLVSQLEVPSTQPWYCAHNLFE